MSKEKGCKCCKQIWYVDMLDKKLKLCPNCYEYCKPLIDDLKIKDKQIANLHHRLKVAEKALELACERVKYFEEMQDKEMGFYEFFGYDSDYDLKAIIEQYKQQAKEIINGYKQDD